MNGLQLDFEWIDPEGARGPELRATWASLEIRFDGAAITRAIDNSSRSVRNSLFLPLYPLAEWFATHWWFLLHEVEAPGRSTSDLYAKRHSLRDAGEGFALPSLTIQPLGESFVRLAWEPVELEAQNLEFTASGSGVVSVSQLREALSNFVTAVLKRLQQQGVEGTLLESEWNHIQILEPDEEEFCIAAASLGLDPYAVDEVTQEEILSVSKALPASLLAGFLEVAEPTSLQVQAQRVLTALKRSGANLANLENLKSLRNDLKTFEVQGSPWRQGYEFAHELRSRLGLNGEPMSSLSALGQALGLSKSLDTAIVTVTGLPDSLDALVATNSQESPGFAVPKRREQAVRFAVCRALFEYLTIPESAPLLVTRARSERQKRNRAFAAEFLAPAHLLRERLPSRTVGDEEVDDIAASFGVSPYVIWHQIENHTLARPRPHATDRLFPIRYNARE
jgi:hypothetical protein